MSTPHEIEHEDGSQLPSPAAFRAIRVLELLAEAGGPLSLSELALRAGFAKSTASNLLVSLAATGVVRRRDGEWSLGFKAAQIGNAALGFADLIEEFRRKVKPLAELARETVLAATLDGTDIVYLARHDGTQPVRLIRDVGSRAPAVVTGLGKAILASLSDQELDPLLARLGRLPRPTERSHRTVEELRADLVRTRERGYAVDDEQNTIGMTCFAVSVIGGGTPVAVSTTLLSQRVTAERRDRLVSELRLLARSLAPLASAGR